MLVEDTAVWFPTGQEIFSAMLAAIEAARHSVRLESYIYSAGALADRFREALVEAQQRGACVRVLIDALGSLGLPGTYWLPLGTAGGDVRHFNPLALGRLGIRNHRKLLVCDDRVAFIGGFNIASEYEGDGVTRGWCDLGLKVNGPLVEQLAGTFDEMFVRAEYQHKRFVRWRKSPARQTVSNRSERLLLCGPGRGPNPITRTLRLDLAHARHVQIVMGYFLPTRRIRRELERIPQRGGQVQLLLAGKSDVLVAQLAARSLYRRLLEAGVQIYEYQPQILHAKLIIIDDIVYAGSANLDQRSLNINYELMVRFEGKEMAQQARRIFEEKLPHARAVTSEEWRRSRSFWGRLKQRWAYFLLVRLDPYVARRQWRALPD